MSSLKIIDPVPRDKRNWRGVVVQVFRLALLLSILMLIRYQHERTSRNDERESLTPDVSGEQFAAFFSGPVTVSSWKADASATILDADGKSLGSLIHTLEQSEGILGYSGSTSLLIVADEAGSLLGVRIFSSEDTPEHVQAIVDEESFLKQWDGLSWKSAARAEVDTVSGATLTSLAIIQSLRSRLGNPQPSLKFPDKVRVEELKSVWPKAESFRSVKGVAGWYEVLDTDSKVIGHFLRSSPVADSVHGYQGPTDFLTFFGETGHYLRTNIRSSYDNQTPETFVDYVKEDDYFLVETFADFTLNEIAEYDEDRVEGVSGATMTSTGVFLALKHAANQVIADHMSLKNSQESGFRILGRDWGMMIIVACSFMMAFSRFNKIKSVRRLYLLGLVVYLGFLNGDMLSQTLMVGWAQHGIPWTNAFSLILLSVVAITVPVFTKKNIYCHNICPFGAAQQLSGKVIRKKPKISKTLTRFARVIPAVLLLFVCGVALQAWDFNLAALEPFDAFNFRLAGYATMILAVSGLLLSVWVPMAYCKYGCPTGAILSYLRRNRRSDRLGRGDLLALLIFVICAGTVLLDR